MGNTFVQDVEEGILQIIFTNGILDEVLDLHAAIAEFRYIESI